MLGAPFVTGSGTILLPTASTSAIRTRSVGPGTRSTGAAVDTVTWTRLPGNLSRAARAGGGHSSKENRADDRCRRADPSPTWHSRTSGGPDLGTKTHGGYGGCGPP